jgi:hypothetical protein
MVILTVVISCMLALVYFAGLWDSGMCVECGGTGGHRKGCPRDDG